MKKLFIVFCLAIVFSIPSCNHGKDKDTPSNTGNDTDNDTAYDLVSVPFADRELVGQKLIGEVPGDTHQDITGAFPEGRHVKLSAYEIGKYEVTWKVWKTVFDWAVKNGYTFNDDIKANAGYALDQNFKFPENQKDKQPVTEITWGEAIVWCNAFTQMKNGNDGECVYRLGDGTVLKNATGEAQITVAKWDATKKGYRLPSQAEWEAAARYSTNATNAQNYAKDGDPVYFTNHTSLSGGKLPVAFKGITRNTDWEAMKKEQMRVAVFEWYFNGTSDVKFDPEIKTTAEVGSKAANDLGLFDMSGNVSEWCYDWGEFKLGVAPNGALEVDPKGPETQSGDEYAKVVRGGDFFNKSDYISVSCRSLCGKLADKGSIGFRLARSK